MITINVKTVVDNTPQLRAALRALADHEVLVGFPEESAQERSDTALTNAALAYIQDHGSPANNIPPRPFLDPGVRSVATKIQAPLRRGAKAALEGHPAMVSAGLNAAGLVAQGGVRSYLTRGNFPALAPATLRRRRAAGFTGTRPLLVTGQLRAAVTYVVRQRSQRSS
jgi:hypothetical protein